MGVALQQHTHLTLDRPQVGVPGGDKHKQF